MNYLLALPEIFLAVAGLALLMLGVFRAASATRAHRLAGGAGADRHRRPAAVGAAARHADGLSAASSWSISFARLPQGAGAGRARRSPSSCRSTTSSARACARFEFPVLLLFATLGMMMMISANDLIALYVGLELQSLALYVVAAFQRDSRALDRGRPQVLRPRRAVLGHAALRRLADLRLRRHDRRSPASPRRSPAPTGRSRSASSSASSSSSPGLAFKVSAVPFHMWTPDVYEGAPTPVTAFFAVAPKIAAIGAVHARHGRAVRRAAWRMAADHRGSSRSPR